jgi:hypothetical protein
MRFRSVLLAASVVLVLASSVATSTMASGYVGGTNVWTFLSKPTVSLIGCCQTAQIDYGNNYNASILGLGIIVLHNGMGQTVYTNVGTANVTAGGTQLLYDVISGVPAGSYNATFFAIASSGVAISNTTTVAITLP